jgi:hypothetical protein
MDALKLLNTSPSHTDPPPPPSVPPLLRPRLALQPNEWSGELARPLLWTRVACCVLRVVWRVVSCRVVRGVIPFLNIHFLSVLDWATSCMRRV